MLALSALGCGSDEEPRPAKESPAPGAGSGGGPTATAPGATDPPADAPANGREPGGDPEEQPGGAGDEDGARSPAMFTGRGGRIAPRVVRVPPYLAVRAELRSADGRNYGLRFGGRELRSGRSLELGGLRPGERLVGRPLGGGSSVAIEASAEPGP